MLTAEGYSHAVPAAVAAAAAYTVWLLTVNAVLSGTCHAEEVFEITSNNKVMIWCELSAKDLALKII